MEEKKPFLQSRKGAAIVMAILILVSLVLGSSRSLGKQYRAVGSVFESGTGPADVSVQECLTERTEYARNLVTVAGRYLSASDNAVKDVTKAVEELEKAKKVSSKYDANVALTDKTATLYDALLGSKLNETDEMLVKKTYQNFKSLNDQISHADYNAEADKYNEALRRSPLRILSGRKLAELFR